jgi:hypothetical protein
MRIGVRREQLARPSRLHEYGGRRQPILIAIVPANRPQHGRRKVDTPTHRLGEDYVRLVHPEAVRGVQEAGKAAAYSALLLVSIGSSAPVSASSVSSGR